MATIRQQKAAKLIVENLQTDNPLTGGEIVESSGYGPSMKKNPQVVLDSDGVKEELIEHYGFNEDRAKVVVGEILEAGENDTVKLKAAEMIFKVHGTYAPEKSVNINVETQQPSPQMLELAKKLDEQRNSKGRTGSK